MYGLQILALALLLFPFGFKLINHKLYHCWGFLEPTSLRQGENTYYIHSQRLPLELYFKTEYRQSGH